MDPNAPFFPLRNPFKDEDAPQKKRKRSHADGEDTAGRATQPAQISNLSSFPSQKTSASPRASTSSSVAAEEGSLAAEGAIAPDPLSSTSKLGVEPAMPDHAGKSRSLPPSVPPLDSRDLSDKQSCEKSVITRRATPAAIAFSAPSTLTAETTSRAPSPNRSAPSLPQFSRPESPHHPALALARDQAASNGAATAAVESSSSSSSAFVPSESRCVRWTEEEKGVLRESLKRELATGRDADYTRALTRAVHDFLQAFPHTKRTCSAIRQAARSLAAAQRESQGGHGREEGAVVTARPSLPQVAPAQTNHKAARRPSDQQPSSNGAASRAPLSKGGSHGSPAREPVSKISSAQLPPQRPHAPQLQRNAVPSGSDSGSLNNASSLGSKSGARGQHTPICAPSSTSAMPRRTRSPVHSDPRTTRQQLFPPPFPTSFPPGEAFAAASITSTPGSSSSAANERPAQDGCAATVPGPAATSDTQATASSFAARAPASSSATKEDGASGAHTGWFTGPLAWPWEKSGHTAKVSTRCPTSSGMPGAPPPEPRSAWASTAASSLHTSSDSFSFGPGGGWRPAFPTRCAPPISETRITSGLRGAAPALKGPHHHLAEPDETSASLQIGIMKEGDNGVEFETCPPNHYIAVYTSWCVKITRDPPSSSGVFFVDRIRKPIFVLQSGEAVNFWTVQMPDDVKTSVKTVPEEQIAGSSPVAAMDTIFYSAANKLCVVFRLEVGRVRSDGTYCRDGS